MKRLRTPVREYLDKLGLDRTMEFGVEVRQAGEADSKALRGVLNAERKHINILFYLLMVLLVVLFGAGLYLVMTTPYEPLILWLIFGTEFAALLGILAMLRRIWYEKFIIATALAVLEDLPPEDAAQFILLLHSKFLRKR
ncbi:MAG: hypothetical protein OEV49_14460 [candidate division Zixibacteria bacterium]|nr:hypothetical protein [candidate division Zixibacteria bacterium]MDH3937780.1 hypothetical protein [candidate division Zixibacteria bacterium]MDH4035257.1 hypothetical protein [candidate division Zixibacteria bacterium]